MLEKAFCLHTVHEEIRGMGNWKRAELRLLRAKTDPLRQWCTCSISSIFCSALTEKKAPDGTGIYYSFYYGALLQLLLRLSVWFPPQLHANPLVAFPTEVA